MSEYQPLQMERWCNVGPAWVGGDASLLTGPTLLRGLPFLLGATEGGESCGLGFGSGGYREPVEIPIERVAHWVIFAHRQIESRLLEGEPAGHCVGVYRFRYQDGGEEAISIRERFEIGTVPVLRWGLWPILAVPDQHDRLPPRREGLWEYAGGRLTEVMYCAPEHFFLWAWRNPQPERPLASIVIEPQDRTFLVGGVTLSDLEEDPLGREARLPVKLTLLDSVRAEQPFDLDVSVDRGVATYPYPLPDTEELLSDPFSGWGQEYHDANSPAYVEIAAQPSAMIEVKQHEETLASVRWGDVLGQGAVETDRARVEVIGSGKNWVQVSVVDDETGRPIPCRVHFRSPEGVPFQPHGHHNHLLSDMGTWHMDVGGDLRLGHATYAYIDGRCEGWLPRGSVLVDAARGYEYEPLRTFVTIEPGQQELTLRLRRWTDMNARRWFSGDSHVHFLSTMGAQREAMGEDLNVVNLLQAQWGHLFTNTEDFVGRPVTTQDGRTIVYTSQENRQHILGHLSLLGLKHGVAPWSSGGPDEAELGGTLETTLSHWADACHEQGGTVVIPHFPYPNAEPATLIATARADAVEMLVHDMYQHGEYYRYLNTGYRLPLVGGTDKMSSDVAVGRYRTYVYIPPDEEFSYDAWCSNLRRGRTFLSGGPMLRFQVEGAMVGDTLQLPEHGGTVEVQAEAESIFPIHTLQIVQEGQVVAQTDEPRGSRRLHLKTELPISHHTWLAARVAGPGYTETLRHHDSWQAGVMAHTSPIYVAVGERWWMFSGETAQYMLTLVHASLEFVRQRSRQHAPGTVTHQHGQGDHLTYLEGPFREAIEAIHRRMHEHGLDHHH